MRSTGGRRTPSATGGSASAALAPDSTRRNRRAVTAGKLTVRAGMASAGSSATSRYVTPSSLACSTADAGGAAPNPRGPGSPTTTDRTVTGSANSCSIHAVDQPSGSRGSASVRPNDPSVRHDQSSIGAEARHGVGRQSVECDGSAGNASTRQSVT